MARSVSLLAALLALAATVAACGGGDGDPESTPEFDAAYEPVNQGILDLAAGSIEAVGQPNAKVTPEIAGTLNELAGQASELAREVSRLEPPEDLAQATQTVETRLGETADILEEVAAAAEKGDQRAAAAALQQLGPVGQELNGAQDFLAEATGAPTGQEE
jgi:hypothetical protein